MNLALHHYRYMVLSYTSFVHYANYFLNIDARIELEVYRIIVLVGLVSTTSLIMVSEIDKGGLFYIVF